MKVHYSYHPRSRTPRSGTFRGEVPVCRNSLTYGRTNVRLPLVTEEPKRVTCEKCLRQLGPINAE